MNIRLLQEEDYLLYKTIRLELLHNHPTSFGSSYEDESKFDDQVWRQRLSKDTVDTYGAFDGEDIVGLAVVVYNPRTKMKHSASLHSMYVKPRYRHQGIASDLINHIVEAVEMKGLYRLNLSVVDTNSNAISLYQSKGFEPHGKELDVILYNGTYHSLLLMSKLLGNR